MERRVLLAIILSFLVLYGYQALFVPQPAKKESVAGGPGSAATPSSSSPSVPVSPSSVAPPGATSAASSGNVVTGDATERDLQIENDRVIATFTNRGARLKSWRLKRYQDPGGQPLELVAHDLADNVVLPFTLQVDDENLTRTLDGSVYAVSGVPPPGPIMAPTTLTFEFADSTGLRVVKTFAFAPASYVVTVTTTAVAGDRTLAPTIVWGPAVGDLDTATGRYAVKARALFSVANKVTRLTGPEVAKQPSHNGTYQFAGVDDHYFMTAAVNPGSAGVTFQHVMLPVPAGSSASARELVSYSVKPAAAGPVSFYVGPKDFDQLAAVDRPLVRAIDFGMFDFVIVPLLRALKWVHGYVGNYGWAIIVLTILINLVMWPLRHKSVVSMRKMQELQPQLKAIQDRYAHLKMTDPARGKMNEEVMALYKSKGANPASGCVPMLLTLPVLFAFYSLLSQAIEIRGAPFALWITDLSLRDPWYITPLLMGGTMFWQQRLQPGTGDPVQQKVLMFMPVMFTAMFMTAPSGLVIYWFVSNLWAIGQQYFTNWLIGPAKVAGVKR